MRHHRSVHPVRASLLLLVVALLLSGCFRLDTPAADDARPPAPKVAPAMDVPEEFGDTARLEPACPAVPPAPLSAAQRNAMLGQTDLPAWEAGDVGASAVLEDGRVFWVYGDTVLPPQFEVERIVSNSVLVTSGTCTSQLVTDETLVTDEPKPIVPETENGLSQWPMSVVRVPPAAADGKGVTDVVVGFLARTQRGEQQWDFLTRGTSMAVFAVGEDGVPRLSRISALTPDDTDPTHIHWGAAATVDGDHVYVYGTRSTGVAQVYGRELYVSRLPLADPTDVAAWEIWDGSRWQSDRERAAPVLGALEGVSQLLSVDRVGDRWIAVSKQGGDAEENITMWSSDEPYGPWETRQVGTAPFTSASGSIEYSPIAHPDLPTPSGALLISVSRNFTPFTRIVDQPELGRPLFSEIPMP